jgi:hypothetical protein
MRKTAAGSPDTPYAYIGALSFGCRQDTGANAESPGAQRHLVEIIRNA